MCRPPIATRRLSSRRGVVNDSAWLRPEASRRDNRRLMRSYSTRCRPPAFMTFHHPWRHQVRSTDQPCFVRMIVKKFDRDFDFRFLEQNTRPGNGKLADAAGTKAATENDALRVAPRFLA